MSAEAFQTLNPKRLNRGGNPMTVPDAFPLRNESLEGEPEVPPFPLEVLPIPLRRLVEAGARSSVDT
jgi:hypothetical protein